MDEDWRQDETPEEQLRWGRGSVMKESLERLRQLRAARLSRLQFDAELAELCLNLGDGLVRRRFG